MKAVRYHIKLAYAEMSQEHSANSQQLCVNRWLRSLTIPEFFWLAQFVYWTSHVGHFLQLLYSHLQDSIPSAQSVTSKSNWVWHTLYQHALTSFVSKYRGQLQYIRPMLNQNINGGDEMKYLSLPCQRPRAPGYWSWLASHSKSGVNPNDCQEHQQTQNPRLYVNTSESKSFLTKTQSIPTSPRPHQDRAQGRGHHVGSPVSPADAGCRCMLLFGTSGSARSSFGRYV